MGTKAIHQNLDTSFVNVSALIKYLRRRQFVGVVKIQLNGYRADIELTKGNALKVKEHDQISGRIAEGEEALQRIFIRAREAGGTVNVFQLDRPKKNTPAKKYVVPKVKKPTNGKKSQSILTNGIPKPTAITLNGNSGRKSKPLNVGSQKASVPKKVKAPKPSVAVNKTPLDKNNGLPDFPFSLSNKVEDKAKKALSSTQDWQSILNLMVELLRVTDRSLAIANINFSAAFKKVRSEISDDYPFLNIDTKQFDYRNGKILMNKQMNAKIFVAGITESIHRIFEKLDSIPKHKNTRRETIKRIGILAKKRAPIYQKYSIKRDIDKITSSRQTNLSQISSL